MSNREWVGLFEPFAQRLIDLYDCPGLVLGVAKDGEPVYQKGFGFRNREQQLPLGVDTVAGIA
ncbi:MAG TPA: serine hydrolase, partial [Symbiobacteriaceae bacterium]|nr:serine hydrolase [Symbiobacteriaceae bacterium]